MRWQDDLAGIDWDALPELYRIAPLGEKSAADLRTCFTNSMFRCFALDGAEARLPADDDGDGDLPEPRARDRNRPRRRVMRRLLATAGR